MFPNDYKTSLLKVHRQKYLNVCDLYLEKYAWISIQLREDLEQWALEQEAAEWNPEMKWIVNISK